MKFPTISLTFGGIFGIAAVIALAVFGIYLYNKRNTIVSAINPTDANNLANQAVNSIVSQATGKDETLGGWLYDMTHPEVARTLQNPTLTVQ
jgi:hypothetical protein